MTRLSPLPLIVGREPEQARLYRLLDAALEDHGRLALVSGEAGIGKTTLVDDLARRATERGALVLSGHCYELSITPHYGPWFDLLSAYQPEDGLPPPLRHPDRAESIHSQESLFEEVRAFLGTLAGQRPLLLVLEDMHWADRASLDGLLFLARQIAHLPILMIVTYRDDDLARAHPLYGLLPALVREARAERIELGPLEHNAVRAWVSQRYPLSRRNEGRLADYLRSQAEGNPFFVTEMLRTMESDGVLRPTLAGWTLRDPNTKGVPLLLKQVIDARLNHVSGRTRELLTVAAVIGHEVPLSIWAGVAGIEEDALLDAIDDAVKANLLLANPDGLRVAFPHALTRSALYQEILPPRRRIWHRQVGEALLGHTTPNPEAVAYHFEQAGDPRAVEWLIQSADRAFDSWALSTAVERYEAALRLIEPADLTRAQRGSISLRLAESYRYIDPHRAMHHVEEAQSIAGEIDDPVLNALILWDRGRIRGLMGGNGLLELKEAYQLLIPLSPRDLDRVWGVERWSAGKITGTITQWLAIYGQYDAARTIAETYLQSTPLSAATDLPGWYETQTALGVAYAALGRPDDSRAAFSRAFDFYQGHAIWQLAQVVALGHLVWLTLVYETDRLDRRRAVAWTVEEVWSRPSSIQEHVEPRAGQVPLLLIEGQWSDARRYLRRLIGPAFSIEALGWLGLLARYQGEREEAWDCVRRALSDGPGGDPEHAGRSSFIASLALVGLAADLALDARDLELAHRWLETHDRWLTWCGAVIGRAENQLLWARYDEQIGDREGARRHAQRSLKEAGNPRQPLALLAAHRTLGQLDLQERRYSRAATELETALALADACAAPYEQDLALLAQAELLIATGRLAIAREALDAARTTCASLEAKPALERIASLEQRLPESSPVRQNVAGLSQRELEVLRLVTEGLTDAQIGERLFISPRTVGQHLRSIYNKLGVNSRSAAVAYAFTHDLA